MSSNTKTYDYSVSCIRVIAMLFIIICHLSNYFGQNIVAQFFNVGVHIFFLISGYLYGGKIIGNTGVWLFKRYLRLIIPSMLWLVVTLIGRAAHQQPMPQIHEVVFLGLNLQGLNFIFSAMDDLFIGPWFFTNIMGCYILFAFYRKITYRHPNAAKILQTRGGVIPLGAFLILAFLRVSTDGALAFFIGLTLRERSLLEKKEQKQIISATITFILSLGIRLLGKRFTDGTVLYDEIISPLTHVGIACSFLVATKWLFNLFPKQCERIAQNAVIRHFDRISIYVYVFHSMFFNGTIVDLFKLNLNVPLEMIIYFAAVISFSTIMTFIGEYITNKTESAVLKMF